MEVSVEKARKAVLVRVAGRVQGVGFRVWTRGEAEKLGLTGWVRNEPDGAVKALLVGSEAAVSTMMERLRQGPSAAAVTNVTQEAAEDADAPTGFRITV